MKKFILAALSNAARDILHDAKARVTELWEGLPQYWKADTDVALAVWKSGCLDEAPSCLSGDIVQQEIRKGTLTWDQIPTELRADESFVRTIIMSFLNFRVLNCVQKNHPHLFEERGFWKKLFASSFPDNIRILRFFVPETIRRDYDLMQIAVKRYPSFWQSVHGTLCRDENFVRNALDHNPEILGYLTFQQLAWFPNLVRASLRPYRERGHSGFALAANLSLGFWLDRDFVLAWFRAGLMFLKEIHSVSFNFTSDEEIFLLIASHCIEIEKLPSFAHASPVLRGSKEFMMQVVREDGRLFEFASAQLKKDFDLFLVAFAECPEHHLPGNRFNVRPEVCRKFVLKIRTGLKMHDLFFQTMCGISLDPQSNLSMLNQGETTSQEYTRLIASYLGIPMKRKLRLYRQAPKSFSALAKQL